MVIITNRFVWDSAPVIFIDFLQQILRHVTVFAMWWLRFNLSRCEKKENAR